MFICLFFFFFFSSRRRHTRSLRDWSSDVCSSDLSVTEFVDFQCERCRVRAPEVKKFVVEQGGAMEVRLLPLAKVHDWAFPAAEYGAALAAVDALGDGSSATSAWPCGSASRALRRSCTKATSSRPSRSSSRLTCETSFRRHRNRRRPLRSRRSGSFSALTMRRRRAGLLCALALALS